MTPLRRRSFIRVGRSMAGGRRLGGVWIGATIATAALWLIGARAGLGAEDAATSSAKAARRAAAPSTEQSPARPNILLVFCDDHALQAISAYRNSVAEKLHLIDTPNIDRLAKEGMRFDRCYVTNSLCGPVRATILTGKYNHLNGFFHNASVFDGSQPTFPKLLQAAGYQTAIIGKWHLVSDPTGFDYWNVLTSAGGQGSYYNPAMKEDGKAVAYEGYTTHLLTDMALDWIANRRDKSKPFLLMFQHKAPHRQWQPCLDDLDFLEDVTLPEPSTLFDDYAGRGTPAKSQDMTIAKTLNDVDLKFVAPAEMTEAQRAKWDAVYGPRNEAFRKQNLQGDDLVRWKYQRYMKDYLRCVKAVDDDLGRLLKYLDDAGLTDNTVVVYSSDQGFYLGEHGWFDKRWMYEESLRAPLIVRWPGVTAPGSVNNDIVSNLDFAETFLNIAGVPIPSDMQGRSLVPLLRGETPKDWRSTFYYHYYEYPGTHDVRRHYGVTDGRYKLIHFYPHRFDPAPIDEWELYDLQRDPKELQSVYGRPEYAEIQRRLHAELERLRKELKEPAEDPPLSGSGPLARRAAKPK